QISRIDTSGNGYTVVVPPAVTNGRTPREIRLTSTCGVRFATATSILDGAGNVLASPAAGSGLAVAFDGSLRYSDGATINGLPAGGNSSLISSSIVGLGVTNGGDGSILANAAGMIGAICASNSNRIDCVKKNGSGLVGGNKPLNLATFGNGDL